MQLDSLEDHVIFLINSVINQLNQNKNLLKFISKNLSWGVFQKALLLENNEDGDSFYQRYYLLLDQSGRMFRNFAATAGDVRRIKTGACRCDL